jgi:anaerobic selenocysteine-containing dehydrogenase
MQGSQPERRTIHKTCNLCEAGCGLLVEVEANRVVRIRADEDDPQSRGHICPKAIALEEIQVDPDRLRGPVRRTPTGWQEISWEEALDDVASNLARIQQRDGDDAVGMYLGNPGAHNFDTVAYIALLRRALATRNQYTASSCDQNPKHAASLFLYGNVFKIAIPDIDRTDFLLMLGANPVVSNGSLMTAPGIRRRLRELKERGGRFVVVDPRRTATAALADRHFFVRPGTDALLLAALVQGVLDEKLGRESHLADRVDGEGVLRRALAPFAPESVSAALGIPAAEIRELARDFAAARSAVCYGRIGVSLHPFATLASWLVDVLNLVTGNLDRRGGALHANPAVDLAALVERMPDDSKQSWKTRVRGAPAFNGEQPAACLAEEIATPGPGQVRGMLTVAGNPVLSTPNGRALERALAGLEYCAAIDLYRNETTRHAHVILPPTWSLEHENYEVVFHQFAVHNSAKYSEPVLAPPVGALREWEILVELALRIGEKKSRKPHVRLALRALRRAKNLFAPARVLDWMLRLGEYGDGFRPWRKGLRLRDLIAEPKGVDLGPLRPSLALWLAARERRIDLGHPVMIAELGRLRGSLAEATGSSAKPGSEDDLLLIGRRDVRTNNSWLHNAPLAVKGRDRCTLLMHPRDAQRRKLATAERVRIRSRVGCVEALLEISDEVMPGVVSLPHGWGHDRPGMQIRVAEGSAGVSVNDLTDDALLEPVVGNAILNGVPVQVEAAV